VDGSSLAAISLFATLDEGQRERLALVCSELEVAEGDTLVQEGDFCYSLFAIVSGSAEVSQNGRALNVLEAGDVFGEIAVLSSGRRTATVRARSPMKLLVVLNRDVWKLDRDSPDVGAALRETITDCLDRSGATAAD
jgi:CRP-like cAMP-binding protein